MMDVRQVGLVDAQSAGQLLADTNTGDVVDALVALLAATGDQLLTSDPDDMQRLVDARNIGVRIVTV